MIDLTGGGCDCEEGWATSDCSVQCCSGQGTGTDCSADGTGTKGCSCSPGFANPDCSVECCDGHGVAEDCSAEGTGFENCTCERHALLDAETCVPYVASVSGGTTMTHVAERVFRHAGAHPTALPYP